MRPSRNELDQLSPVVARSPKMEELVWCQGCCGKQDCRARAVVWEFPSSVILLNQLVTSVKDMKFGWQGSGSFESCHRGILPFSAAPLSWIEAHQRPRALKGDAEQATMTTVAGVEARRTRLPPCPLTVMVCHKRCMLARRCLPAPASTCLMPRAHVSSSAKG